MILAIALLAVGLALSAFFSGSETGFYRVSRMRLTFDAVEGDFVSRRLLWLAQHPALFVASILLGNNLANYLISFSSVLLVHRLFEQQPQWAELASSVVLSPVVFVYGELLPKSLFYHAPYRLVKRVGPLILFFTALFAPVSAVLWAFARGLQWMVGESPERLRARLARQELQGVFHAGQEAGLLSPLQRRLVQGMFALAGQSVDRFCLPAGRVAAVRLGAPKAEALRLARRQRLAALPVQAAEGHDWIGYVRVVDLQLAAAERVEHARPLLVLPAGETHGAALIQMQSRREPLAKVVDGAGQLVGLLPLTNLVEPLFRGG